VAISCHKTKALGSLNCKEEEGGGEGGAEEQPHKEEEEEEEEEEEGDDNEVRNWRSCADPFTGIEYGRPGWEAVEMAKILVCCLVVSALAVFLGLSVAASEVLDFDSSATVVPAFLWTDQR
jgi:hypothetical protein